MTKRRNRQLDRARSQVRYFSYLEPVGKSPRKRNRFYTIEPDYYVRTFHELHAELTRSGWSNEEPHPLRQRFWQFPSARRYESFEARGLLQSYLTSLQDAAREIVSGKSLLYWLHCYRRLFPGPVNGIDNPATIVLTRAVMEAAIQKYADLESCGGIAPASDVPIERVLNGRLLHPKFELERHQLAHAPRQMVLTEFALEQLVELYTLEKLAFEVWRVGATLRAVGKGASLLVFNAFPWFAEDRDNELDELITNYDERTETRTGTATGVVFEVPTADYRDFFLFLPHYNTSKVPFLDLSEFLRRTFSLNLDCSVRSVPNFIWYPFQLKAYFQAHDPFNEAFQSLHGVSFRAVLLVLGALLFRVLDVWRHTQGLGFMRYLLRAYEGPFDRAFVLSEIRWYRRMAERVLGLDTSAVDNADFENAIAFWTLTPAKQSTIDLVYSGPHYCLLPWDSDRYIIDYAWLQKRFYDLFVGVRLSDQKFKGEALEAYVRGRDAVLPTNECRATDGTKRQIDASFPVGDTIVIAECKAVGQSIGFFRGDPDAIAFRRDRVVKRALREVDEKATWLSLRPSGRNYDITKFRFILPVAVSPFKEYIHSTDFYYWITSGVPRVLSPAELCEVLGSADTVQKGLNRVRVL